MGVYARNNKLWISFTYDDRQYRIPLGLDDTKKNRALQEANHTIIKHEISEGTFILEKWFPEFRKSKTRRVKASKYFSEVMEMYMKRQKTLLKRTTFKGYEHNSRKIMEFFEGRKINNIDLADLDDFVLFLKEEYELCNKAVNNHLIILRGVLEYARKRNYISEDLKKEIKNLKVENPEIHPFEKDEVIKILNHLSENHPHHIYTMFVVLFFTGMRIGEVLAMKWKYLNLDKGYYFTKERITGGDLDTVKTKRSKRYVKLSKKVIKELRNYQAFAESDSEFIFVNKYGMPYHSSAKIKKSYWLPTLQALNIPYRIIYQTRHTYASLALEAGDRIGFVAKQLGHQNFETLFKVYANFMENEDYESKFDDYLIA